jgi:hypothetical protein
MIIQDPPGKAKCPECGSENIATKWSLTTIVAWVRKLLGVPIGYPMISWASGVFKGFFCQNSEGPRAFSTRARSIPVGSSVIKSKTT